MEAKPLRSACVLAVCGSLLVLITSQVAPVFANSQLPAEFRRVDALGLGGRQNLFTLEPVVGLRGTDRIWLDSRKADSADILRHSRTRIPNHPSIDKYVLHYQGKGRRTFAEAVERSWDHLPRMMEILEWHGIPRDLVYIVLVESRFKQNARSQKGAAGPWQFMPSTARAMGLKVGRYLDERLDPIKSTEAAAKYLNRLHQRFGTWPLALAAYNAGSGAVTKALQRVDVDTFWELYRRHLLSLQTRQYVPKVLAAIQVARNMEQFGFDLKRPLPEPYAVYHGIQDALSLTQISKWTGVSIHGLRQLNPSLCRDRIPSGQDFDLRLPVPVFDAFCVAYQRYGRVKG